LNLIVVAGFGPAIRVLAIRDQAWMLGPSPDMTAQEAFHDHLLSP